MGGDDSGEGSSSGVAPGTPITEVPEFSPGTSFHIIAASSKPMSSPNSSDGQLELKMNSAESLIIDDSDEDQSVSMKNNDNNGGGNGGGHHGNDPLNVTAINITVTEVQAYHSTLGWLTINNQSQNVNLLSLTNNAASLLANHLLEPGTYYSIRLRISSYSTAVVNGNTAPSGKYPL